jgi:hypothetical protein
MRPTSMPYFRESRRVRLVEVSMASPRSTKGRLRVFCLSVSEEEGGVSSSVARRRNGSGSGWQIHF